MAEESLPQRDDEQQPDPQTRAELATDAQHHEAPQQEPQPEPEEAQTTGDQIPEEEPMVTPGMNWFVLRVASNKEDSVRRTLLRKIKIEGFEHLVNRILVPTEKTKTIKGGKQRVVETKLYPGYVFVEMQLDEDGRIPQDVFFLIKETTGVGDFIGTAGRPSPMTMPEIEKMLQASKPAEEQPEVKMEFQKGDHVKIREGPFENMEGTVDELLPEQGKVRVNVTIFGRSTPIELEYWLIERVEE
ncbi:MAG: transcription termination/antitermination protein NusG [bacterium]